MSLQSQFFKARELCKEVGLYILREGTKTDPSWRFLSCATGRFVGQYSPVTRTCFRGGRHSQVDDWEALVREMASV